MGMVEKLFLQQMSATAVAAILAKSVFAGRKRVTQGTTTTGTSKPVGTTV